MNKGWIFICCIVVGLFASFSNGAELKVMTFNIRYDNPKDGANAWPKRNEHVVHTIRQAAPDIIGLQEGKLHMLQWLQGRLDDTYAFYGIGRNDGFVAGEFSAVMYRKTRFNLIESRTRWCSETPDVPSTSWDISMKRSLAYVVLYDFESKRGIKLINTHFDHKGPESRLQCAKLLLNQLQSNTAEQDVVLAMGDFNFFPKTAPYRILHQAELPYEKKLLDSALVSEAEPEGPDFTANRFDLDYKDVAAIDFIFVASDITVLRHQVLAHRYNGHFASDHFAVMATLSVEEQKP